MIESEAVLGLPGYQITEVKEVAGWSRIRAIFTGEVSCPDCRGTYLRTKGKRLRRLRHENWGERRTVLELESRKFQCLGCNRFFWQRFPGIQPHRRASEPYRRSVYRKHYDGISRSRLSKREGISGSTVERWFLEFLQLSLNERKNAPCPPILGIDEHFFSRRHGYATTFCDLRAHRIHDVVLGRSEASLESYLNRLEGKQQVRVVCMDLASVYRSLVRKHFPNARIVADRFHVIRLSSNTRRPNSSISVKLLPVHSPG